jgi:uncharacterized damage-inducible protein DinB
MRYEISIIREDEVPTAAVPAYQHAIDTYASETNKVCSTWLQFREEDLNFHPHPRSSSVQDIMRHQLLSERRFFGEFLGLQEPMAGDVLPPEPSAAAFAARLAELARPRLSYLAGQDDAWWLGLRTFFDVRRQRIWIFWRRILHTAHHRTQLTVYLRLLGRPVPSTYGPTADVTWSGADPTLTVDPKNP